MSPKKIVIKKRIPKAAGDTYTDAPMDIPQLRTRRLKAPAKPKIVNPDDPDETGRLSDTERPQIFKFYCIRCGQKLAAQVGWVGRDVNCTTCNSLIKIPDPPED